MKEKILDRIIKLTEKSASMDMLISQNTKSIRSIPKLGEFLKEISNHYKDEVDFLREILKEF